MFYQTQTTFRPPKGPKNAVFVPGNLDLWPSNSSKQGTKHVFQIRSAVPGNISYTNKKTQTTDGAKKQNLLQFTACGNELILIKCAKMNKPKGRDFPFSFHVPVHTNFISSYVLHKSTTNTDTQNKMAPSTAHSPNTETGTMSLMYGTRVTYLKLENSSASRGITGNFVGYWFIMYCWPDSKLTITTISRICSESHSKFDKLFSGS